jgi:hypothetical protein
MVIRRLARIIGSESGLRNSSVTHSAARERLTHAGRCDCELPQRSARGGQRPADPLTAHPSSSATQERRSLAPQLAVELLSACIVE